MHPPPLVDYRHSFSLHLDLSPHLPFPAPKMLLPTSRSLLTGSLALGMSVGAVVGDDLDSFVSSERAIALQGALNNIGPDGSEVAGASAGFVVASPSNENPNCKFESSHPPRTPLWARNLGRRLRGAAENTHKTLIEINQTFTLGHATQP